MLSTKMIGNKIAEARKKVNISQAQLAQRLFISPQAVGKWERGESTHSFDGCFQSKKTKENLLILQNERRLYFQKYTSIKDSNI
jgi:transcriptional regulator with XRE-family HTH domain